MEVMKHIQDKEVDLAIVDPEYGIGAGKMNHGIKNNEKLRVWKKGKNWDSKPPEAKYFQELFRVSKDQIIFGANYFQLPPGKGWIYWSKDKQDGLDQGDGELAWTSFLTVVRETRIVWDGFRGSDSVKIHPTQKPVSLYKWLLSRYAKPGDKILDTHGGSGSICIACHDLGYELTWMELDHDYYAATVERYKRHAAQAVLFEPEEVRQEPKEQDLIDAHL